MEENIIQKETTEVVAETAKKGFRTKVASAAVALVTVSAVAVGVKKLVAKIKAKKASKKESVEEE